MLGRQLRSRRCRVGIGPVILFTALCAMAGMLLYSQKIRTFRAKVGTQTDVWVGLGRGGRQTLRRADMPMAAAPRSCPLYYQRTTYEEVRKQQFRPYLLGGPQRPSCSNCHKSEELWSEFCQFKSHGPTCTGWDQWKLLDSFIQRAEAGAPGVKEMLTLTPCDLFEMLEGRTLWLVGDSMTQEFHRAMQCFFYEFWDLTTHDPMELTQDPAAKEAFGKLPSGWCVFLVAGTRICHLRSNYGSSLAEDTLPNLHRLGAVQSDVVLFNFGVWHNDLQSFQGNVSLVASFLRQHRHELPLLIWRETAPQHFDTPLGEFACDGCPEAQGPYKCKDVEHVTLNAQNELESEAPSHRVLLEGGWRNRLANPVMTQLGIPILHVWNQSMPIWEYHHNFQAKDDCTHMCHPSAYQVWVYQFYELLGSMRDSLPAVVKNLALESSSAAA